MKRTHKDPASKQADSSASAMEEKASSCSPKCLRTHTSKKNMSSAGKPFTDTMSSAGEASTDTMGSIGGLSTNHDNSECINPTISNDAKLYILKEKNDKETHEHLILKMPSGWSDEPSLAADTCNVLMLDVSGSMGTFPKPIQQNWNDLFANKLRGETKIYTFDGTTVNFRRNGTTLEETDFDFRPSETKDALQKTIVRPKQKFVNVFIFTGSSCKSRSMEDFMKILQGKVCHIYFLGVGKNFLVEHSIDIHSRFHNGSTNFPTYFWAKVLEGVKDELEHIKIILSGRIPHPFELSVIAKPLPGLPSKNEFYLGEYVYLPQEVNDKELELTYDSNIYPIQPGVDDIISTEILLDIFRQWKTIIMQRRYNKEYVPPDIISLMERLFKTHTNKPHPSSTPSLAERIRKKKESKGEEMEFMSLIKSIKSIVIEQKYADDQELAESILVSSIKRNEAMEERAKKLWGHDKQEFEQDFTEFMRVLEENKRGIQDLTVDSEYCCAATKQCTIADLQDQEGLKLLRDKNKFEFLKSFTMTGMPVFSPTLNSVNMNPWSYSIQRIVGPPYAIMSQVAMETIPQASDDDNINKERVLECDNAATGFNAIIPVFTREQAEVLQPVVRTQLYSCCATFAIQKNAHIRNANIHMASLGVLWIRCLYENENQASMTDFGKRRRECIEATAACYMDRVDFATYATILQEDTPQALMTESIKHFNGKAIKCETIVKPLFILYMIEKFGTTVEISKKHNILRLILLEYVGRCVSHMRDENNEYTHFFNSFFEDEKNKREWLQKYLHDAKLEMNESGSCLLESYYTLEKVRKMAQIVAKKKSETMKKQMIADFEIEVNMEQAIQLRHVSTAGDLSLKTIKTVARTLGLEEHDIEELFSKESMFLYVAHALSYPSSKSRMSRNHLLPDNLNYLNLKSKVTEKYQKKHLSKQFKELRNSLVSMLEECWLDQYFKVHNEVVEPMSVQQIVYQAQDRGIDVTEETFSTIYKRYRPKVGLLGNACQSKACPYYLNPDKTYNQHASVERIKAKEPFMHALHLTSHRDCEKDLPVIIKNIASGVNRKPVKFIPTEEVEKLSFDVKRLKNIYAEQSNS